ncbi:hypothetical protein [uncultured Sphingomonas sp.]|uniref:hypothetical protein n=1 Tax=uncultured Sphingomonas sp. TaxID=158754 RepID=UPI002587E170|nr:hypothetical protein [uncultured Sphingomonas sp.]
MGQDANIDEAISPIADEAESDHQEVTGDAVLNLLVHFAELGVGSGITLFCGGAMLSGILISKRTFFEQTLAFAETGGENPVALIFKNFVETLDPPLEADEAIKLPVVDYHFLHLRNAQVMTAGQEGLPNGGALMRVSRDDISGWSLGQLTVERR